MRDFYANPLALLLCVVVLVSPLSHTSGAVWAHGAGGVVAAEPAVSKADAARQPPECATTKRDVGRVAETDRVVTNSIGMKLVLVPAGEFMMGFRDPPEEMAKAFGDEKKPPVFFQKGRPLHRVRITKSFYIGAYAVTRGQFRRFIDDTGYKTEAELAIPRSEGGGGGNVLRPDGTVGHGREYTWETPGFPQTDEHPVVNVSWSDAVAFCRWLSCKEGKTYRLPTEAEWEYACRAGTEAWYSSGDDPEKLVQVGNVADGTLKAWWPWWKPSVGGIFWVPGDEPIVAKDGYVFTAPVGQFKPNPWGLYDMHGNVWEWCADTYDYHYYRNSPLEDPAGPSSGDRHDLGRRVARGGSFHCTPALALSSFRAKAPWCMPAVDGGFRVVRTVGAAAEKGKSASGKKGLQRERPWKERKRPRRRGKRR